MLANLLGIGFLMMLTAIPVYMLLVALKRKPGLVNILNGKQ